MTKNGWLFISIEPETIDLWQRLFILSEGLVKAAKGD